mmetsp:Transcript_100676/g.323243  ORF Transcript_100676/g.323243 Transcript_100676/m.323243 type:complete len:301 (+) Transcript_100676:1827-2729(+)
MVLSAQVGAERSAAMEASQRRRDLGLRWRRPKQQQSGRQPGPRQDHAVPCVDQPWGVFGCRGVLQRDPLRGPWRSHGRDHSGRLCMSPRLGRRQLPAARRRRRQGCEAASGSQVGHGHGVASSATRQGAHRQTGVCIEPQVAADLLRHRIHRARVHSRGRLQRSPFVGPRLCSPRSLLAPAGPPPSPRQEPRRCRRRCWLRSGWWRSTIFFEGPTSVDYILGARRGLGARLRRVPGATHRRRELWPRCLVLVDGVELQSALAAAPCDHTELHGAVQPPLQVAAGIPPRAPRTSGGRAATR